MIKYLLNKIGLSLIPMSSDDAIGSFENIAEAYVSDVDTRPFHLYYHRPHLWSLLPTHLKDLNVLDLGCGSGWFAEQLVKNGAKVTCVDASSKMIELTKNRIQSKGEFHVADLAQPLDYLTPHSFDLVLAPLIIHYIKEWEPFFKDIARVLKVGGSFIFSTHQPHIEVDLFKLNNYFEKTLICDHWPNIGEVRYYHHTLQELFESLYSARFVTERVLEPSPLPEFEKSDPVSYQAILKHPSILLVSARKT